MSLVPALSGGAGHLLTMCGLGEQMARILWIYYLSKIPEFIDTVRCWILVHGICPVCRYQANVLML